LGFGIGLDIWQAHARAQVMEQEAGLSRPKGR